MKKINSLVYGGKVIAGGILLAFLIPLLIEIFPHQNRFLSFISIAISAIDVIILVSFSILLIIELHQDKTLNQYYVKNKNQMLLVRKNVYECQSCGNRQVKHSDRICGICGIQFIRVTHKLIDAEGDEHCMRASGILLPISSLPSEYGIGTFGKEAYDFVDKLKKARQKYWQVLPLGGTSYGDSPYQSFSTFAGNPYFIDVKELIDEGLVLKQECDKYDCVTEINYVDYAKLYNTRYRILRSAYWKFNSDKFPQYKQFCDENSSWLDDYCLFMALKDFYEGVSFLDWPSEIKNREKLEVDKYKTLLKQDINFYRFIQFKFFEQWNKLKAYANKNGIQIIGDIPIYVALDSADTWSNPELFMLDKNLKPTEVAGCPPDDYAKTGQLWGNPIYNWVNHKRTDFEWWIKRIKSTTNLYDLVRIDHFRGFAEYYSIPAKDKTAENGVWVEGPGIELFNAVKQKLGKLNIIAEDLGFLTPSVRKMLRQSGFPGMKVIQFGLYNNSDSDYLPYKYTRNTVCYTGTHDNQTTTAWLKSRKSKDKAFIRRYINKKGRLNCYDIITLALASASRLAVIPIQDYLEIDDSARMNIPSTIGGINWQWRLKDGQFSDELAERIAVLVRTFGR